MAEITGWFTMNGMHIPIMKGQSKAEAAKNYMSSKHGKTVAKLSSKTNKKENSLSGNKETDKAIEKIRNAKKENLIVTDENGNILAKEGGNNFHTGYSDIDYKDKITYHNHPDKVYPYPSKQDFKTAEQSGMKKMVVVSKGYTYSYEIDNNYKGYGRQGLSSFIDQHNSDIQSNLRKINDETIKKYKNKEYKSMDEYKLDTKNKQIKYVNEEYIKLAKNSGYKLTITEVDE